MVIQVLLVADGPDGAATTVSTTIEITTTDPRWPVWLVDAITFQAPEGARRLRDQLIEQQANAGAGFVPLAAVVPAAQAGRSPARPRRDCRCRWAAAGPARLTW